MEIVTSLLHHSHPKGSHIPMTTKSNPSPPNMMDESNQSHATPTSLVPSPKTNAPKSNAKTKLKTPSICVIQTKLHPKNICMSTKLSPKINVLINSPVTYVQNSSLPPKSSSSTNNVIVPSASTNIIKLHFEFLNLY